MRLARFSGNADATTKMDQLSPRRVLNEEGWLIKGFHHAAQFPFLSFGQGKQRSPNFVVLVTVDDVRAALHSMAMHGNAEAAQMKADLELGRKVREMVEKQGKEPLPDEG